MVRFRFSGLKLSENKLFLPDYDTKWVEFEPDGTCKEKTWADAWEKEKGRDFVHRVNSKYLARYTTIGEEPVQSGNYSTFAIIVCFVIVACIIVPQVLQIFSALFFPSARHLPSPPSPPPVPKSRKRMKLYHFRHTARRKITFQKA
ncbi:unnamed protein product [Orchesella dallaii]|uniref:Uncharacterized protein n=1 Tax=Orchesella dallaii TaxID=48710 RepID=A0ABP1QNH5_9HEXA